MDTIVDLKQYSVIFCHVHCNNEFSVLGLRMFINQGVKILLEWLLLGKSSLRVDKAKWQLVDETLSM